MADSPNPPKLNGLQKRQSRKALAKAHVKAHYDTYMPNKKHHRILLWVVFFACSSSVALQMLYPPDRALPLMRISGQSVAWYSHERLADTIDTKFRNTKLKLTIGNERSVKLPLAKAGAEPNTEPMIERLVDYPFWQRFIPFSILLRFNDLTAADVYYTESVLKAFSDQQAKQLSFAPVNARLAIDNGKLTAITEKRGIEVTAVTVRDTIAGASPLLGGTTELQVSFRRTAAKETALILEAVRAEGEAALSRKVIIVAGDDTFTPDSTVVASWLQIGTDDAGRSVLRVADDKVNEYFDTIDKKTSVVAGTTNINLTDGRETSRTTGSTGRAIDRQDLKSRILSWLLLGEGQQELLAVYRDVAPGIMYDNKYTATEEGLRAYVADAAERLGVTMAIQQIDGEKWTASARADKSMPSASTYKLFVSKWLFDRMDRGEVQWEDRMLDTTVSTCFDRMTIASTNPCAESWLAEAGRTNFNQYVYGLGFSQGTSFTRPDAAHTTANDLQKMMLGINDGSIIGGANRDRLLQSLRTHRYRDGIPAGSAGEVWDKVGFLWDYVHDTAIVRHPKGTYVMTIMTKGRSYATIASLTREVERIMYP